MKRNGEAMCLLGFVGFGTRLNKQLQGLLRRCDWTPVCFETLREATEYTSNRLCPDAVALHADLLATESAAEQDALADLLRPSPSGRPLPLFVVGRRRLSLPPPLGGHPGIHVIARPGTYYEHFGTLVYDVIRPAGACCRS